MAFCKGCKKKLGRYAATDFCRTCRSITGKEHGRYKSRPGVACATEDCENQVLPMSKLGFCSTCTRKRNLKKQREPCTQCGKLRTRNATGLCRECWQAQSVEDRGVKRWVYVPTAQPEIEIQNGVGLSARFAAKRKNATDDFGHTHGNDNGTD